MTFFFAIKELVTIGFMKSVIYVVLLGNSPNAGFVNI